jgi:hypothetical protein
VAQGEVRFFLKQIYWFMWDNFISKEKKAQLRDRCKEEIVYPELRKIWSKLNKTEKKLVRNKFKDSNEEIFEKLDKTDP